MLGTRYDPPRYGKRADLFGREACESQNWQCYHDHKRANPTPEYVADLLEIIDTL
jgi:hypothetical protein